MVYAHMQVQEQSLLFVGTVNGETVKFILDTGDALGPTFNNQDAQRLGLVQGASVGIEGAGGASTVYQTTATITLGDVTYENEPSFIDTSLDGPSLLGLPFFLAKGKILLLDWANGYMALVENEA